MTPDNVLLDEEGHAYLADLGVAALVGDGGSLGFGVGVAVGWLRGRGVLVG